MEFPNNAWKKPHKLEPSSKAPPATELQINQRYIAHPKGQERREDQQRGEQLQMDSLTIRLSGRHLKHWLESTAYIWVHLGSLGESGSSFVARYVNSLSDTFAESKP